MKIEDLTLTEIDGAAGPAASPEIVRASAYAARRGWGNRTCYRFVVALIVTNQLRHPDLSQWDAILKKIENLQIQDDLAALMDNRVVAHEIGGE